MNDLEIFKILFIKKDSPQYEARIWLYRIMHIKNVDVVTFAREIGVAPATVRKFFQERDLSKHTLVQILEYISFEKTRLEL